VRAVVVGASSGLGRCIGVGLGQRGAQVALLARRRERLAAAAAEAGAGALAIECDVTGTASITSAIAKAAADLGGIDALVYTPAIGPLARLADTAAILHLAATAGTAAFLSSVSASRTPPWPGLGAYIVSKAALDKMVEAWRVEHPTVGFTRCTVGDCMGGEGDSMSAFPSASEWDWDLAGELHPVWQARGLLAGCFIDVEDLVNAVDGLLRSGQSLATPSITLAPRPQGP